MSFVRVRTLAVVALICCFFTLPFASSLWAAGGPGFRTQHLLEEHYLKHGREFGSITQEQYLHFAQQLRDSHAGKFILESRRADRGGAKFDRRRGWFVAYDGDGTIRTFFVPNDGIRYFERQTKSYGPPE